MNTALVQGVADSADAVPANGDGVDGPADTKEARSRAAKNVSILMVCTSCMLALYG